MDDDEGRYVYFNKYVGGRDMVVIRDPSSIIKSRSGKVLQQRFIEVTLEEAFKIYKQLGERLSNSL